ncbi:hypothetical protein [Rhizobium rhizogenes]|uniref:hypothetical protein n=1 Tax=Rhizobium rhizogenes TaxID=359 RepID=UPI001571F084|nr:hypothetical protein [Rhizobium rhizogenes]NTF85440.1 hypothetical protein [Rhizobium rhizogenes]NTI31262.1 hypothetical protein [Rhizobium rhizogenes]QRM40503.1 hypothetical protein F3X89_22030 [Rhizobium rhizogenes]
MASTTFPKVCDKTLCVEVEFAVGEMLDAVRAEANLSEVAAIQRSNQPIEDDQAALLAELAGSMLGERMLPLN